MKRALLTVALMLVSAGLIAGDNHEATIRSAAEKASLAVVGGRMEAVADSTYPGLVTAMGGRSDMIIALRQSVSDLSKRGLSVEKIEVGEISDTVTAGDQLHAVVRIKRTIKAPTGRQIQDSFMLAISSDAGKNWTFVEGRQMTPPMIEALFPNFNGELVFPKTSEPVFVRD